ncbi:MAG: GNAT family N-acetyltransferase [Opitutaceae bacterium]|nr:GNAT family N-acetyltransferase [Opitutaceae bacterium]
MPAEILPTGAPLPGWVPPLRPSRIAITGRTCRMEPLDTALHASALFEANAMDRDGRMWTYLAFGPFETSGVYREWVEAAARSEDSFFFAIVDGATGRPVGVAAYMRIDPANGSIEIGNLAFSPALQRTTASTEAMYLMIRQVFQLGYRRCEWKCNSLNAPSRAAAVRLGFTYEGTFRQAAVAKGCNRDTDWFSIIDTEWPALRAEFERWLSPDNFAADGRQLTPLGADRS